MTLARSVLLVAPVVAVGVSLAMMFFLRDATRQTVEPEATRPVENATAPPVAAEFDSIVQIVDLLESQPRVGSDTKRIYSPTYVPEGFTPDESTLFSDPYFGSHYSDAFKDLQLMIAREPFYHYRPEIEPGHVEEVTVNGQTAYLVRGDWMTVHLNEQAAPFETWDFEISLRVYLNLGDAWFMISVLPFPKEHGFDERELLRVAESMRPTEEAKE